MLRRNKLTKTLAVPIATGAAALGVLAGSVLTATSANAAFSSWDTFKTTPLIEGNTKITYVSDTFALGVLPAGTNVELNSLSGTDQFLFDPPGAFTGTGTFTYIIETTDPSKYFSGVQIDSTVLNNPPYGIIKTTVTGAGLLESLNGWPFPADGSFAPISGTLGTLTVLNQLPGTTDGALNSLSNVFKQEPIPSTSVPEPGTILGLLTVGGLGLVSRFRKEK